MNTIGVILDRFPVRAAAAGGTVASGRGGHAAHARVGRRVGNAATVHRNRWFVIDSRVVVDAVVAGIPEQVFGARRGWVLPGVVAPGVLCRIAGARPVRHEIPVHTAGIVQDEHDVRLDIGRGRRRIGVQRHGGNVRRRGMGARDHSHGQRQAADRFEAFISDHDDLLGLQRMLCGERWSVRPA